MEKQIDVRCQEIIKHTIRLGRAPVFSDIRELYDQLYPESNLHAKQNMFIRDRDVKVPQIMKFMNEILLELGCPPMGTTNGKSFQLSRRPFLGRMQNGYLHKRRLVQALIAAKTSETDYFVPRTGSLFLSYGTTMHYLALEMVSRANEFRLQSLSTTSLELASLFYFGSSSSERTCLEPDGRLCLCDNEVDWRTGSLIPMRHAKKTYDTAIVSFDGVASIGNPPAYRPFTNSDAIVGLTNQAMSAAQKRVIIVGDSSKFDQPLGGQVLEFPKDKIIYFITDKRPRSMSLLPSETTNFELVGGRLVPLSRVTDKF